MMAGSLLTQLSTSALVADLEVGIAGVTCSTCGYQLQRKVQKLNFVKDVKVSMTTAKTFITLTDNTVLDVDKFNQAILESGFSLRYMKSKLIGKITKSNGQYFIEDAVQKIKLVNAAGYNNTLDRAYNMGTNTEVYGKMSGIGETSLQVEVEKII